jgi:putative colanic acid biosynthesis UDP-glucose lipid carrier transferase
LLAVLAFIGAAEFLDLPPIQGWQNWRIGLRGLANILARWSLVIAFIWTLLHLSGLTEGFNSDVLLTWTLATPLVLWLDQVSAQYVLIHSGAADRHSRRAVIVGVTELGIRLENTLRKDRLLRTQVLGYFEDRAQSRLPADNRRKILGCSTISPETLLGKPRER